MLLALRINVLAKGFSGIRLETAEKLVAAFNSDCLSIVPEQGTVGTLFNVLKRWHPFFSSYFF